MQNSAPHSPSLFKRFAKDTSAFSIIELTIVIAIIGILMAAVLGGRTLMDKARMNALRQDVNVMRSYVEGFRQQYRALPGDFRSAPRRLTPRGDVAVVGGNGNNQIDSPKEQVHFWQHLALAGIINGITVEPDPELIFGETAPTAQIGGGYVVTYEPIHKQRRHWFRLSQTPMKQVEDFDGVLTPEQAMVIDRDLDDGSPVTGDILATGNECVMDNQYSLGKDKACVLYFSF